MTDSLSNLPPMGHPVLDEQGHFTLPWYRKFQGFSQSTNSGGITQLTGAVTAIGPGVATAALSATGVTPGAYTAADITVGADGRISAAASGSAVSSDALSLVALSLLDGTVGARGAQGAMGPPGYDGQDGEDGWTGPPGPAGSVGPPGLRGAPGEDGEDGADGLIGPPGVAGAAGATGATGPTGPAGLMGFGFDGADGEEGPMGPPGPATASGGGSGTVTTTGSPTSGNLTKFSGATSITNGDLSGDVTTSGALVTTIKTDVALAGNPTTTTQTASDSSTRIATTAFVAAAVTASNPAMAVQAATTAASDTSGFTYNNGVAGIGATLTGPTANVAVTIDGYTFTALGQRLLVKNDTQSPSGAFNGVYYVTTLQAVAIKPTLTRALDYDMPSDINNTGAVPVVNGTVNADTSWLLTSTVTTVGTDPLTYIQFTVSPTGAALSVLGVTGNASTIRADIVAGSDKQVFRRSGTAVGFGAVDLTSSAAVTGALTVTNGGTGAATLTNHGVLLGQGTGAVVAVAPNTAGFVLTDNGASADPSMQAGHYQYSIQSPTGTGTVTISSIPAGWTDMRIRVYGRSDAAATSLREVYLQFNTDTAGNYDGSYSYTNGSTTSLAVDNGNTRMWIGWAAGPSATAGNAGYAQVWVMGYAGSTYRKICATQGGVMASTGAGNVYNLQASVMWRNTAAITSVTVFLQSGNWVAGSTIVVDLFT